MTFVTDMNARQTVWRKRNVSTREKGVQNGKKHSWIIPAENWTEGLWPDIRPGKENDLEAYLACSHIQKHSGVHNLKSSWILGANLYFAHRQQTSAICGFLNECVCEDIMHVQRVELEWVEPPPFDPKTLLGERGGRRGASQTSPDVAFAVKLKSGGRGLVLTEVKFTEHSFYRCTGRVKKYAEDPERCLDWLKIIVSPNTECRLRSWASGQRTNRRYWDHIIVSENARESLRECPAAKAGYQLFRQQALAEALAKCGTYERVFSIVAYDERNTRLVHSMRASGISDFSQDWGPLFDGLATFGSFSHQQWVKWVRHSQYKRFWEHWLCWVNERYGY